MNETFFLKAISFTDSYLLARIVDGAFPFAKPVTKEPTQKILAHSQCPFD
jgi:hypothetical protein